MHVPVRGEHLQGVAGDAHRYPVLGCQAVSGQRVAVLVFAGGDLVADDAGELDVLGRVVGVHVMEHRQGRDRFHGSAFFREDREHGLAGMLRGPSPAGGQGLDDLQAASAFGVLVRLTFDGRNG